MRFYEVAASRCCFLSARAAASSSAFAFFSLRYSSAACLPATFVAVSKKHLPSIIQPFDPNTPREYDGLLRLLSFQTGHNPATHAGAYALDRAYPAKLQPDLVERYFHTSRVWHQFLGIAEEGPIAIDVGSDVNQPSSGDTLCTPSFPPHKSDTSAIEICAQTDMPFNDDTVLGANTSVARENEQSRKRNRSGEGSIEFERERRSFLYYLVLGVEATKQGQQGCFDYLVLPARLTAT